MAGCTKSLGPTIESTTPIVPPGQTAATTGSTLESSSLPRLTEQTDSVVYLTTDTTLTIVDVDSAVVSIQEIPELAPGDPLYRVVSRGDLLVFYGETETGPAVYRLNPRESFTPMLIDEAWFFVPSADIDHVWLAILDTSSPDTVRALDSVREVTVDGTVVTEDIPTPGGRWPVGELTAGLLFQGDSSLEVWDPLTRTFIESFPGPFPVAMWQNRIATCAGSCERLELFDLDTDTHFVVDAPTGMSFDGYGGAFSPDGRYLAVPTHSNTGAVTADTQVVVTLIDFEAGSADAAEVIPGSDQNEMSYPKVAWSPDSEWLFFVNGSQILAYAPGDATAYPIPVELTGPYFGMAAGG